MCDELPAHPWLLQGMKRTFNTKHVGAALLHPPLCSPQQGQLFVWFSKSQLNAKQEPARSGACQRQSIPFLPFPVLPVADLDPTSVWVGFKSFLTGPVGDCDASPWRELWKMVSGSGLTRLGWIPPQMVPHSPWIFPPLFPKDVFYRRNGVSSPQNPHGTEIINPSPASFPLSSHKTHSGAPEAAPSRNSQHIPDPCPAPCLCQGGCATARGQKVEKSLPSGR